MKSNFFIILILFIVFAACEKDDNNANDKLVGQWSWTSTNGGLAFHIHESPLSTGRNIIFNLKQDYTYAITENDIVVAEGTYSLSQEESIHNHEMELFLNSSNNDYEYQYLVISGIITNLTGTELSISDNYYDGIGSGYVRLD